MKCLSLVEATKERGALCRERSAREWKTQMGISKNAYAIQKGVRLTIETVLRVRYSAYEVEAKKPQKKRAVYAPPVRFGQNVS